MRLKLPISAFNAATQTLTSTAVGFTKSGFTEKSHKLLAVVGIENLHQTASHSVNFSPLSIQLNVDKKAKWLNKAPVKSIMKAFFELGFQQGHSYSIAELKDVNIVCFFNGTLLGTVYKTADDHYEVELFHESDDGHLSSTSTDTNAAFTVEPSNRTVFRDHRYNAEKAVLKLAQECDIESGTMFNNDNFSAFFERLYKESMAFQQNRGGISYEEFKEYSLKTDQALTEAQIHSAFLDYKVSELAQWHDVILNDFIDQQHQDNKALEDGQYFIVPHKGHPSAFIYYLSEVDMINEHHVELLANSVTNEDDVVTLFNKINTARKEQSKANFQETIYEPIEADVYHLAA